MSDRSGLERNRRDQHPLRVGQWSFAILGGCRLSNETPLYAVEVHRVVYAGLHEFQKLRNRLRGDLRQQSDRHRAGIRDHRHTRWQGLRSRNGRCTGGEDDQSSNEGTLHGRHFVKCSFYNCVTPAR